MRASLGTRLFRSMESQIYHLLYLLAVAALLVEVSQAVIWGPQEGGVRGRGQIQPKAMEIPDASVSNVAGKTFDPVNR